MEFISQKDFDTFLNSLGNGLESSEFNEFQNFFVQNDFSTSSALAQNQTPSFIDHNRDNASNVSYPIAGLPYTQGNGALANSFEFDPQSQSSQALSDIDAQTVISSFSTTSTTYPNELFGNSDMSSPDQNLSDSNYAYSSSGPSSPSSNSVLSAAPSSPEIQLISEQFNQQDYVMEVPANYGMEDQNSCEIPSPQVRKPVVVKQELNELVDELEARLGWSTSEMNYGKSKKRNSDSTKEIQQEKHKISEKQRRTEMNDLLDRLKQLLPHAHTAEAQKMTKIAILSDTVDYVTKLQELCKQLLQENRQLKAQHNTSSSGITTASSAPVAIGRKATAQPQPVEEGASKKRKLGLVAGVQQKIMDGSRAIFLSVFFLMVVFSPYADHPQIEVSDGFDAAAQTRSVLTSDPQQPIPPAVAAGLLAFSNLTLASFLWSVVKWGFVVLAGFAFMVWGDRSVSTSSPNFAKAKEWVELAHIQALTGQWWVVQEHMQKALELLEHAPPRSYFMTLLLTVYQLWRHIMHRLVIGVYIERFIATLKGTEKESAETLADVSSILLKCWHKGPPNVEWLYICLDSINTARVLAPSKVLLLTASSTFRIRGNTGMAFRMWEIYIDWGLRSMKDSIVDSSLEQKHLFYSAEGMRLLVQGELPQARANYKKAMEIATLMENDSHRLFILMKTMGVIAKVLLLEQKWEQALELYIILIKKSENTDFKAGIFWGAIGMCTCLLRMKQIEKAKFVRKYFMIHYNKFLSTHNLDLNEVLHLEYRIARGKYSKALGHAELAMKTFREHKNDVMIYALHAYLYLGNAVLALWEDSLAETSSIRAHASKLARMSHEACSIVTKAAAGNPVIQPGALVLKGQYYFLLKNYPKAKYYWTSALEIARKLHLKADEKIAADKLSTHAQQLEIQDDHTCPRDHENWFH
mmetsp:Transcript_24150/g.33863  ORF Transcript_24150/g.33863 Transcript_24150/m.33863 type:complete len:921 (+) Transcript_24150:34-2796(+)